LIHNKTGSPYRVFSPFWRACRDKAEVCPPRGRPRELMFYNATGRSLALEDLELLPGTPNWAKGWENLWQPGSTGAHSALQQFLCHGLTDYDESRNHPAREACSRLSPHLHFGELSARQLWHAVETHCQAHPELRQQGDKFRSELGWREFNHHLLYHFPRLPQEPFKPEFNSFPYLGSEHALHAWQRGQTGYPIVDAGMRELWQTGYMHNRVRMIAASFLTKHLLIPWQAGQRWFWDTLVDADLANNSCGWQWVAGSGADAAPYFRIFNPTLQGRKFDTRGRYIRRWLPELADLPDRYLHEPAIAPPALLAELKLQLGHDYPLPIVEHRAARDSALTAYQALRSTHSNAGSAAT